MSEYLSISSDVKLGKEVKLSKFINLYGCEVGDQSKIGAFVEIQKNAKVGRNCKISSHTFICEGVTIEDDVFVGHSVTFINDSYPRATTPGGRLQTESDWKVEPTLVKKGASIGSGSTILSNVTIGENALVGAGSVVTRDVPADAIVAGNPAKLLRYTYGPLESNSEHGSAQIPFVDLASLHKELREELVPVFDGALQTASFVGGPSIVAFEKEFARFCDVKHCIGVGSGTDALRFALVAAGVQPGDAVITVPNTFIATAEAISQAGARPIFVDIDERTYNMDPSKLEELLSRDCSLGDKNGRPFHRQLKRTVSAVVPVQLYGQTADMDRVVEIADRNNLIVVEDACQAHGAEYFSAKEGRWRKAGSMGRAAAFSFYPGKNLGACGEAGAVTTNDEEIAHKARMLRDHGQSQKYYHEVEGYNARLDSIQAGILRVKLRHLLNWNENRRMRARKYNELFAGAASNVVTPHEPTWSRAVYHLYVIQVDNRQALQTSLAGEGIATGIHYPIPLHLQKAYADLGYARGDFPVSERVVERILSLPMFPGLSELDQARVVDAVTRSVQSSMVLRSAAAAV